MSIFVNITDLAPGQAYAFKFRSFNGDGYSDWSQIFRHRTTGDLIAPEAIAGLEWDAVGGTFVGRWNKVIYDAQGKRLDDFKDYEVKVTSGSTTKTYYQIGESFTFGTDQNKQEFGAIMTTLTITVAARDYTGNVGGSATKTATDPVPPTPSTPVTSINMGQVVLAWDGKTNVGGDMPYNFSYVEVHASTVNNFTPSATTLNSKQTGKFQIAIDALTYGTPYYFKLIAINELARQSVPSGQATGTPARISGLDIQNGSITTDQINFAGQLGGTFKTWFADHFPTTAEGAADNNILFRTDQGNHQYVRVNGSWVDAQDSSIASASQAASTALTAANGKNKNVYSTSDATGTTGYIAGDQWFKRDANGVIIAQWEFTTSWQPRTVSGVIISSLDAGKITTGTLDAARIAANSITADRLTVGALSGSLANNGQFADVDSSSFPVNWLKETGTGFVGATYTATTTAADVASGTRAVRLTNAANNGARLYASQMIPATAGESISVNAWLKGAAAYTGNSVSLSVMCYDATGTFLSSVDAYLGPVTATYAQYGGQAVLPANTKQIRFAVVLASNASVRNLYVSDVAGYRPAGVTMIADGAISTAKLSAGSVTADKVGTNQIITASANIGTAVIDSTNIGSVNAGTVTLGTLKSSQTAAYGGITQPVWSVGMTGAAVFAEMSVIGQLVVGSSDTTKVTNNANVSMRSYNYLAGTAGWALKGDGSIEASSGTFRGTVSGATINGGTINGTSITSTSTIAGVTVTGGAINGATITGGLVQTSAATYPRVYMDTTGLYLQSSPTITTASFSASTGTAVITGVFKSNYSGQRVEINSSFSNPSSASPGTIYSGLRIYGATDSYFGEIGVGNATATNYYTLQMISPGATTSNGSFLRLHGSGTSTNYDSAHMYSSNNVIIDSANNTKLTGGTVTVTSPNSTVISGSPVQISGSTTITGTSVQITGGGSAGINASNGQVNLTGVPIYFNSTYGYIAVSSTSNAPLLVFSGNSGAGALKFATFSDGYATGLSVLNSSDTGYQSIRHGGSLQASDVRIKSNITPANSMLQEVLSTAVYEYDIDTTEEYSDSTRKMKKNKGMGRRRGIIAQEAPDRIRVRGSTHPEASFTEKQEAIDMYAMTATAWGAVRELYAIIEELREEIDQLKGKP